MAVLACFFSACSEIVLVKCEVETPPRPLRSEFNNEFEFLRAIFDYVYNLESARDLCYN